MQTSEGDPTPSARGGGTVVSSASPDLLPVEVRGIVSRKITDETAERFAYGFSTYKGQKVQVAQYRDAAGRVIAQKLRTADKRFLWLGKPDGGLFGGHLIREGGRMLVVTEGELDALAASQVMSTRFPATSVPSGAKGAPKAFRDNLELLESFEKVVILFDQDDAGREAALECAEILSPGKACIATLPLKDACDMLVANRREELADACWRASQKPWRPDGVLSGEDLWSRATEWRGVEAVPYPHEGLNRMTGGMRRGEIVVIAAGPGTGKSVFCRELASHLLDRDQKVAVLALEGSVYTNLLGLLTPRVGRALHLDPDAMSAADVRGAFEAIQDRLVLYDCAGERSADRILSKIRYVTRALGCTHVFLDNLSIVVGSSPNEDERRFIDQLMMGLEAGVREIGYWLGLVSHLKNPDSKGKQFDEGRLLSLYDLRGSGMIGAVAYDVIGLSRDMKEGGPTTLQVLKSRHTGLTGIAGKLGYDPVSGRLVEAADLGDLE